MQNIAERPSGDMLTCMTVTVELPEVLLTEPGNPGPEVVREVALSAFARGRISRGELQTTLALDRWSLDRLLADRGLLREVSLAEAEADAVALARLLK